MSYVTVEVEINNGHVIPRGSEKLPDYVSGLLTILPSPGNGAEYPKTLRKRVILPLIRGNGKRIINPTPEELDASGWSD